jgi:hypothetical protein
VNFSGFLAIYGARRYSVACHFHFGAMSEAYLLQAFAETPVTTQPRRHAPQLKRSTHAEERAAGATEPARAEDSSAELERRGTLDQVISGLADRTEEQLNDLYNQGIANDAAREMVKDQAFSPEEKAT